MSTKKSSEEREQTLAEKQAAKQQAEYDEKREQYRRLHPNDPHTADRLFADWKAHRDVEQGNIPPAEPMGAGIPAAAGDDQQGVNAA